MFAEALSLLGLMVFFGLGIFAVLGVIIGAPPMRRTRAIPRGRVTERAAKRAHADAVAMDEIKRSGMARA